MGLFTIKNDAYYLSKMLKYYRNGNKKESIASVSKKLRNPNAQFKNHQIVPDGLTQLHLAAYHGDIKSVKRLIEENVRIESPGVTSPILYAMQNGYIEIVMYLFYKTFPDVNGLLQSARTMKNQVMIRV